MKIKSVEVTKLFGMFDHVIPFSLGDRITIIHGPNGFGKTALLRMIQSIFSARFGRLRRTPFEEILVSFEGGSQLKIRRYTTDLLPDAEDTSRMGLDFTEILDGRDIRTTTIHNSSDKESVQRSDMLERLIDRSIPSIEVERVGRDNWLHGATGSLINTEEVVELYGDLLPIEVQAKSQIPDWLSSIIAGVSVKFIEAQRLFAFASNRTSNRSYGKGFSVEPAVVKCASEMATLIREKQTEYGKRAQQLDSSFPSRALTSRDYSSVEPEELERKLQSVEGKQQRLLSVGILPSDQSRRPIPVGGAGDEATRRILALYIGDVEDKLKIFDSITTRVETLQRIINSRFSYKRLEIDAYSGFKFINKNETYLQLTDLSSGEQHELVLLYELLFKTQEDALILIDEPELSLHVAWQVQFLNDLSDVAELSSFDVLMATHSPQVINDRWDLTVELKGPEDD